MTDVWKARRQRVLHWLAQEECAAEAMLEFYLGLLETQEPLYRHALASGWNRTVAASRGGHPSLRLERLPLEDLRPAFERFLSDVSSFATEVLAAVAKSLEAAGPQARGELLATFLRRNGDEELARRLALEPLQLSFYPRAFFQPMAMALAQGDDSEITSWQEASCPRCGWPPQLAMLKDEPEIKGHRYLVCSLCSSWWTFRRSTCPYCGETDPKKLVYHTSESLPHLRVEECQTCSVYTKAVDLRKNGHAVAEVDELASLELDLWAEERGLTKLQRNLLGL